MEIYVQTSVCLLCCVGSGPTVSLSQRRIRDWCPDKCWFAVLCRFWPHCQPWPKAYSRLISRQVLVCCAVSVMAPLSALAYGVFAIPLTAPMFVSCECRALCRWWRSLTSWSLVKRSPKDARVCVCDLENSAMRRSRPKLGCCIRK
jgi:hypothetical protein